LNITLFVVIKSLNWLKILFRKMSIKLFFLQIYTLR
jgi:hypothetical protein